MLGASGRSFSGRASLFVFRLSRSERFHHTDPSGLKSELSFFFLLKAEVEMRKRREREERKKKLCFSFFFVKTENHFKNSTSIERKNDDDGEKKKRRDDRCFSSTIERKKEKSIPFSTHSSAFVSFLLSLSLFSSCRLVNVCPSWITWCACSIKEERTRDTERARNASVERKKKKKTRPSR